MFLWTFGCISSLISKLKSLSHAWARSNPTISWRSLLKKIIHLMMFRSDPKYLTSLGQSVINIIRLVPHGVLIFFPSYRFSIYFCLVPTLVEWWDLPRASRSIFKFVSFCAVFLSVLWISFILVRIRIRGSVPHIYGSGFESGSCLFRQWLTRCQQNISFFHIIFA